MEGIKIKAKRNRTSRPRFNLELQNGKSKRAPHLIFLVYRYKKDAPRLKYSISEFIPKVNFDQKMQRAIAGTRLAEPDADRINKKLRGLHDEAKRIATENPDISIKEFKLLLDYFTGDKKRPKTKADYTLLEYFRLFINRSTNHQRTILKYETTFNQIKDFEAETFDSPIRFDQINTELSELFANFLYRTRESSQNYASRSIQVLKQVVKDAHENGYHSNTMYQSRKFGIKRIQTSKHFLEIEELEKLAAKKLDIESEHRTRDLWLIGAYTGLRISDLHRLDYEKHFSTIDGIDVIDLNTFKGRTTKQNTRVVIPVLPQLQSILERLDYKIPKSYSEQRMNDYIKDALQTAEIDRMVETKISKSGKIEIDQQPIYSQITNHSARYTFINIMLNDFDIPAIELVKITGQTLKTLSGYERGDKKKNAVKVYAKPIAAMRANEETKLRAV